jgi:DNA-binding NarL/FixJ family response regulator
MTKVLIADDHEVVRAGLRALLSEQPDLQVVAEAADGKEAVAQALKTAPDVAIVDYSLPVLNGLEVTRQIRQLRRTIRKADLIASELPSGTASARSALVRIVRSPVRYRNAWQRRNGTGHTYSAGEHFFGATNVTTNS